MESCATRRDLTLTQINRRAPNEVTIKFALCASRPHLDWQEAWVLQRSPQKDLLMTHAYWNDWYFGWGWLLWIGFIFLMFSGLGNWGYTYNAHRKYDLGTPKGALDILNERYARGEITREQFMQLKADILAP
jgi:putative membrane protein